MKKNWIWYAPEYFDKWRVFPRVFISMYLYLLYEVTMWFMAIPEPSPSQAGLVSVIVGVGAAWFGIYVNGTPTKHTAAPPTPVVPTTTRSTPTATVSQQTRTVPATKSDIDVAKPATNDSYDSEYER